MFIAGVRGACAREIAYLRAHPWDLALISWFPALVMALAWAIFAQGVNVKLPLALRRRGPFAGLAATCRRARGDALDEHCGAPDHARGSVAAGARAAGLRRRARADRLGAAVSARRPAAGRSLYQRAVSRRGDLPSSNDVDRRHRVGCRRTSAARCLPGSAAASPAPSVAPARFGSSCERSMVRSSPSSARSRAPSSRRSCTCSCWAAPPTRSAGNFAIAPPATGSLRLEMASSPPSSASCCRCFFASPRWRSASSPGLRAIAAGRRTEACWAGALVC